MLDILSRELLRKAFHLTGSLIPIIYYFLNKETAVMGLAFINAVILAVEWMRLNGRIELPVMLLRPHENKQIAAYIYFQMAALFSILAFDKTIAIAALLMLAFGDTASGLAGAVIGRGDVRNNNAGGRRFKPLSIMAVTFAVCAAVGYVLAVLPPAPDMVALPLWVYLAGAIGATLGDAVPVRVQGRAVDDNLIIPVLAGAFMTAVRIILKI